MDYQGGFQFLFMKLHMKIIALITSLTIVIVFEKQSDRLEREKENQIELIDHSLLNKQPESKKTSFNITAIK